MGGAKSKAAKVQPGEDTKSPDKKAADKKSQSPDKKSPDKKSPDKKAANSSTGSTTSPAKTLLAVSPTAENGNNDLDQLFGKTNSVTSSLNSLSPDPGGYSVNKRLSKRLGVSAENGVGSGRIGAGGGFDFGLSEADKVKKSEGQRKRIRELIKLSQESKRTGFL
jgi:hypothetical protein